MSHRITVVNNAVSPFDRRYCIKVVDDAEKYKKLIPFHDNPSVSIIKNNNSVDSVIRKYSEIAKQHHKKLNGFKKELYTTEAYLSLWQDGSEAGLHIDSHQGSEYIMFSTVVYLNEDYSGGEIYFPNQDVEIKPSAGDMVLFPSGGHEYFHGVKKINSGRRYTIAMWHTMHSDYSPFDMPNNVNPRYRSIQ